MVTTAPATTSSVDPFSGFLRGVLDSLSDGVYLTDRTRRVAYWNAAAERITGYSAEEMLGKRCSDQVLVHVDEHGSPICGPGCPLTTCLRDGVAQEAELYLRHKEGHRIRVRVRVVPLHDRHGVVTGAAEIFTDLSQQAETSHRIAKLEQLAFLDPLTRLANRRFLELHLDARRQELDRFGWPFGVLMFDIDRFKVINDTHGHKTGDQVLVMVARTALGNARPFDLVARYGGEEFVQVVSNVSLSELRAVAERLRNLVRHSALIIEDQTVAVTVSVGAAMARRSDTIETLLDRADALVYCSKRDGRDLVTDESQVRLDSNRPPPSRF